MKLLPMLVNEGSEENYLRPNIECNMEVRIYHIMVNVWSQLKEPSVNLDKILTNVQVDTQC